MQQHFKADKVQHAFQCCGLFPWNAEALDYSRCVAVRTTHVEDGASESDSDTSASESDEEMPRRKRLKINGDDEDDVTLLSIRETSISLSNSFATDESQKLQHVAHMDHVAGQISVRRSDLTISNSSNSSLSKVQSTETREKPPYTRLSRDLSWSDDIALNSGIVASNSFTTNESQLEHVTDNNQVGSQLSVLCSTLTADSNCSLPTIPSDETREELLIKQSLSRKMSGGDERELNSTASASNSFCIHEFKKVGHVDDINRVESREPLSHSSLETEKRINREEFMEFVPRELISEFNMTDYEIRYELRTHELKCEKILYNLYKVFTNSAKPPLPRTISGLPLPSLNQRKGATRKKSETLSYIIGSEEYKNSLEAIELKKKIQQLKKQRSSS